MHENIDSIHRTARDLRETLERAQAAAADIPWLARFPEACCNFTSNLLLIDLSTAGIRGLRRMIGTLRDDKGNDVANHVWVVADGAVVDIAADSHGLDKVIVTADSAWHASLSDIRPFIPRVDHEEGVAEEQLERLRDLYRETLDVLGQFRPD